MGFRRVPICRLQFNGASAQQALAPDLTSLVSAWPIHAVPTSPRVRLPAGSWPGGPQLLRRWRRRDTWGPAADILRPTTYGLRPTTLPPVRPTTYRPYDLLPTAYGLPPPAYRSSRLPPTAYRLRLGSQSGRARPRFGVRTRFAARSPRPRPPSVLQAVGWPIRLHVLLMNCTGMPPRMGFHPSSPSHPLPRSLLGTHSDPSVPAPGLFAPCCPHAQNAPRSLRSP